MLRVKPDEADWTLMTFAGARRSQREKFAALSLRDRLLAIEQLSEVAEHFARGRCRPAEPRERPDTASPA